MSFAQIAIAVLLNLLIGPLGEDMGWTGFALPRLMRRYTPLVSGTIMGLVWGLWHLPAFFVSGLPQQELFGQLPFFFLGALTLYILITWVMVKTKLSVIFSVFLHLAANLSMNMLGLPLPHLAIVLAVFVVIIAAMYGAGLSRSRFSGNLPAT